jgi:hypothetical protein
LCGADKSSTAAWLCPLPANPLSELQHYHIPHKPSKNSSVVGEVPVQAVRAYEGSRGIAPHILNVSTTWRRSVSSRPGCFNPAEEPPVPFGYDVGWAPRSVLTI